MNMNNHTVLNDGLAWRPYSSHKVNAPMITN